MGTGTIATVGGAITLAELKSICKYAGWKDTTTDGLVALRRFINNTVYLLSALAPWPEYLKRDGSFATVSGTSEYLLDESNIDRIGTVERSDVVVSLDEITIEDWHRITRTTTSTGSPTCYAVEKLAVNTIPAVKMLVYPTPTSAETIYYTYFRRPIEMYNDTDYADWSADKLWLLEDALAMRLAKDKKDTTGWSLHSADFMAKVYTAIGNDRGSYKPIKVCDKYDSRDVRIRDMWWQVTQ